MPWSLWAATPSGRPARAGLSFLPAFEEQHDQRYQLLLLPGEEVIGREHHGLARAAHALEHCGALGGALLPRPQDLLEGSPQSPPVAETPESHTSCTRFHKRNRRRPHPCKKRQITCCRQ